MIDDDRLRKAFRDELGIRLRDKRGSRFSWFDADDDLPELWRRIDALLKRLSEGRV